MAVALDRTLEARDESAARAPTSIRSGVLLALVLSGVALAHSSALRGGFVWDDHPLIDEQPLTQELRPLRTYFERRFWADPTNPESRTFYRPLVSLSYAVEWQIWGGRATGFHATNLLLHVACCALVFALARRAGASALAAALAAALFGTLPRLTESVAWVSGRTDVMASLGALGALLLHRVERGAGGRRVAAAGALFLGLLCKEVALAGLVALAAHELALRRGRTRRWREAAANLVPALVAVAAYLLLRVRATAPEAAGEPERFGVLQHLLVFPLQALGTYAWMLLDPFRPRTQIGQLGVVEAPFVALGAGAAVVIVVALGSAWRRGPPAICALAFLAAAAIAPVLHLVPLDVNVVAADRFLYLPLAGLLAAAAVAAGRLPDRARPPALALGTALLVAFGVVTHLRAPVWGDDLRLWQDAAAHAPRGSTLAFEGLGSVLSWHGRPDAAIEAYRRALEIEQEFSIHPGRGNAHLRSNLALVLSEVGRYDEARALLARVVAARPDMPIHRFQLGAVEARALDFAAAEASLEKAIALAGDYPMAELLLEQVRVARRRMAALPPPSAAEPLEVVAERAAIYSQLGRLRDADALWSRVAAHPEATPRMLLAAAFHLATRGIDPAAARRVLALLRARGAPEPRVAELERALAERRLLE
jgi:tetratricopeptide (TPR) repeat protein